MGRMASQAEIEALTSGFKCINQAKFLEESISLWNIPGILGRNKHFISSIPSCASSTPQLRLRVARKVPPHLIRSSNLSARKAAEGRL